MAGCHDKSQAISSLAGLCFLQQAACGASTPAGRAVKSSPGTGSFAGVASRYKRLSVFNEAPGRPVSRVIQNFPDAVDVMKWRLDAPTAGASAWPC